MAPTGPIEGDVIEVVRTPTTPVPATGRARPAWAEGSGLYARAYSSASADTTEREPAPAVSRGTSWDAGTLSGPISPSSPFGQPGPGQENGTGGVYRSTTTEQADDQDRPAPWVPDLHASGRHAAVD
jgi:hypothetical protein